MDIQSYQKLLINDIFKNNDIEDCQGNVSEILKTIYSQWFFYEHNFNNPIRSRFLFEVKKAIFIIFRYLVLNKFLVFSIKTNFKIKNGI